MNKNTRNNLWIRWALGGAIALYALQRKGWQRWLGLSLAAQIAGINTDEEERSPSVATDLIDEASAESFPASDAPSFAGQRS